MLPVLMSKAFRIVYLHTGTQITPTRMQKKKVLQLFYWIWRPLYLLFYFIMQEIGFRKNQPLNYLHFKKSVET